MADATTLAPPPALASGARFLHADPSDVFTPEGFDADERLMIETAEGFCRHEVLPRLKAIEAQEEGLMPRLVREAGELGLCGVDTGDAYGGLGLGKNLAARILEMMSLNGSFSVTYGITSGISQVGLSLFGTEAQKTSLLPPLAEGREIGAYALSEPNSGSDALSATTRAVRDGDDYVLDGTKMWISNAKWASQFLTLAKVDGERFTAFLVPRDAPGVSVGPEEHKMGLKGSSTARLVLDGARIPASALLHEEGKGHQVAFNALNIGRFKLAAMSIGPCRDAIALGAGYARERKQFGQAIASFGLIQEKLALAAAKFFAIESAIYRTGADIDAAFARHGGTTDGNRRAAEEFAIECSAVKVVATEMESEIVDEMLQIYGGYGFTEEYPIARHYRDARVSRIYEGTNEINRIFLADRYLKKIGGDLPSGGDAASRAVRRAAEEGGKLDQIRLAALSDLLMLAYVAQSSRLRAAKIGGMATELDALAQIGLAAKAAEAEARFFDGAIGGGVGAAKVAAVADAVHASNGPLRF